MTPEEASAVKEYQCKICEEKEKLEIMNDGIADTREYVVCVRCKTKVELPKCISLSSLNTETWTCSQTFWKAQSSCVSGKRSEDTVTQTKNCPQMCFKSKTHVTS